MIKRCIGCYAASVEWGADPHYQDLAYGAGNRSHTQAKGKKGGAEGELRCTVCSPPRVKKLEGKK